MTFLVILGGITILVVGLAWCAACCEFMFDGDAPEILAGFAALIVGASFFIWLGVWYATGPFARAFPSSG